MYWRLLILDGAESPSSKWSSRISDRMKDVWRVVRRDRRSRKIVWHRGTCGLVRSVDSAEIEEPDFGKDGDELIIWKDFQQEERNA